MGTLYGHKCCLGASERFEGQPGPPPSISGAHHLGAQDTHWARQGSHLCIHPPGAWEAARRVLTGARSYMITHFKMPGNGLGMGLKGLTG